MRFCEKCGSLEVQAGCPKCMNLAEIRSMEIIVPKRKIIRREKRVERTGQRVERVCSKCKHGFATVINFQSRAGDEGETYQFTCNLCGKVTRC